MTPIMDDTRAPQVSALLEGQVLSSTDPFTFTWPTSTARRPQLPSWRGPERSAHAHGEPYTRVAYLLTFHTADNSALMRVATGLTSYSLDASNWNLLKTAGGPNTVQLTEGRTKNNNVALGGGPYTSSSGVTFTIGP